MAISGRMGWTSKVQISSHLAMKSEEEVGEYGKKRRSKREDKKMSLNPRLVEAFVEQVCN